MNQLLPKYYLIKRALVNKIEGEELKADDAIPSERELMEIFNVSRITVRKAVDELATEGYLYKIQGKGTFVKGRTRTTGLSYVTSCTQEILEQGFVPSRKILSSSIIPCSKKLARELQIDDGEPVFYLERLYYADGEPVNYCCNFLPCRYFSDLDKVDFTEHSVYETLKNRYGVVIEDSTRFIEAVGAYDEIAGYLEVAEGYPLLHFDGVTRGLVNNKPVIVEVFNSNYRTEKIKFYIDQKVSK